MYFRLPDPGAFRDLERMVAAGGDLRCDTPAHRFAADRQLTGPGDRPGLHGLDHGAPAALQSAVRIGNATAVLAVKKVEGYDVDPTLRERGRESHHKDARLVGPRSVSEDQCHTGRVTRRGGIS